MKENENLKIIPEYSDETGCFLGYSVKKGDSFILNNCGEKLILIDESYDNSHASYEIVYGGSKWHLSTSEHEKNAEPLLKFYPEVEDSVFKGYAVRQFDFEQGKIVSRGFVDSKDVTYRWGHKGSIDCFYLDVDPSGETKTYFIQNITHEEYENRPHTELENNHIFL